MKNKSFVLTALIIIISAALLVTGCKSTSAGVSFENSGAFGEQIRTPAKDFTSMGLVFSEVTFQVNSKGNISGDTFTYQALLKEAHKLNADAIINIVIDNRIENVSSGFDSNKQQTWYGSALAIKFTDTLRRSSTVTTRDEYGTTTTVSETIEFNGSGVTQGLGGGTGSEQPSRRGIFGGLFGR